MKTRSLSLIVAATAIALYLNALPNGFVFDDNFQVLGNEWIRDPANVPRFFLTCRQRRPALQDIALRMVPFTLAAAIYMALRYNAITGFVPFSRDLGMGPYALLLNALSFFGWYMLKLVLPLKLNIYHVLHPVRSLWGAAPILSIFTVAAIACALRYAWKKDGAVFLGLSMVVLPVLPVLYIPALSENAFGERYLYLPSAGLMLALSALAAREFEVVFRLDPSNEVFRANLWAALGKAGR